MDMAITAATNLRWLLQPAQHLLDDANMTDLHINGPGEDNAYVTRGRGVERITLPFSFNDLDDIAINAAALTRQDIAEDVPLVSTRLPDGQRVQIARPPAVPEGTIAISIRRPKAQAGTPDDLAASGVFARASGSRRPRNREAELADLHRGQQWEAFLSLAIVSGLNIVWSGKMGTGKTHNMRAFIHRVPKLMRLVTIEDLQELIGLPLHNVVHLLYSKGGQSVSKHNAEDLVAAALRMGMDGMLNQELRDEAALAYMNVLDSGHWGMTTVHADTADDARDRIRKLIKSHPSGRHLDDADVRASLQRSIDVVVHCVRDPETGHRYIEQVLYDPEARDRYGDAKVLPMAKE